MNHNGIREKRIFKCDPDGVNYVLYPKFTLSEGNWMYEIIFKVTYSFLSMTWVIIHL